MRVFMGRACNLQGVRLMAGALTREEFQFFKEYAFWYGEAGRASFLILGQEERTENKTEQQKKPNTHFHFLI